MKSIDPILPTEYVINNDITDLDLSDKFVAYSCGSCWKMIKLSQMIDYVLLYDKYTTDTDKWDITLVVCPITLYSCTFVGQCKYVKYNDNVMILENNNKEFEIIDDTKNRYELFIGNLASIMILFPDIKYITIKKDPPTQLSNIKYYESQLDFYNNKIKELDIHPKTLVYLIAYRSKHTGNIKKYIILGVDISKETISGYNIRNSKFLEYLMKIKNKITERNGYIVPSLYYCAKLFFPDAKYIYL